MRRFIQLLLLLLLLSGSGVMWYLYRRGFSQSWREWVVRELRDRGAEVSFSKLTVEPFRGLVARDVKLYDSPERKKVLARVDEMLIEANYARAARGEPFIEALTLVDASAQVPLDPKQPDGPSLNVRKLNTRLLLTGEDLLVSRLDAEFEGLRVSAAGRLTNLTALSLRHRPDTERSPLLLKAMSELLKLRHDTLPPRLDLRVNGDLAHPESIVVEADLTAENLHHDSFQMQSVAISAVWKDGVVSLPRFDLHDAVGRLQLSASYDTHTQLAEAHMRSGIDLPALAKVLGLGDVGELTFQSIPQIELTARVSFAGAEPQWLVFGWVNIGRFQYGRVPFDRFHADLSTDGHRWAVRDFVLRHQSGGELRGDAQQDYDATGKGDFRVGLTSTLNPEALAPLVAKAGRDASERLALLRFYDAPRITLSARGPTPLDSVASGDLTLGHVAYRGVDALSARANLRYNGRVLYVDDFLVRRTEGIAGGALAFDFPANLVQIKQVRTNVYPIEAILWVDPTLVSDLKPYRFGKKPPTLLLDGVVDQRRVPLRTRLGINVEAPSMTYEFEGQDLHFDNISSKVSLVVEQLTLANSRAELFGGTVKGDAAISINKAKPGHEATLKFTDVDFSSLTKLYFNYDESKGKLNADYHFTGLRDDTRTMKGEGEFTVTEGNVFAIPFLGPLSEILNKFVPGMGYNKAHRASAAFTVADGVMATKKFLVEGKGFSMVGDGRVWFLEDRMDFDMRINARGLPGVLLFPVSKLLEVRSVSKFSKPEWHIKALPTIRPIEKSKGGASNDKPGAPVPDRPDDRKAPPIRPLAH